MERKWRQDTEENEALLEHEDVQDDEQPDDCRWDDALYVEDSDDSEYLYLLIQPQT